MALTRLADGELAAVVTYLEMRAMEMGTRPAPARIPGPLALERRTRPDLHWYRGLFRRVGAPWLWFSRLAMDDGALAAIVHDPAVEVYAVTVDGVETGLLELDFRTLGACELAFVALAPEWTGRGHGRALLAAALDLAWRPGVARVHLQTCTLDHPAALPAYLRAGFVVGGRAVETFPDPRVSGVLETGCAPQVPTSASVMSPPGPVKQR